MVPGAAADLVVLDPQLAVAGVPLRRGLAGETVLNWSFSSSSGWPGPWVMCIRAPLWIDRDSDLRRAVRAVDPDDQTLVLPKVRVSASATRVLIRRSRGGVGLGALSLLVGAVVRFVQFGMTTMIAPPLGPVSGRRFAGPAGRPARPGRIEHAAADGHLGSFEMAPRFRALQPRIPRPVRRRFARVFPRP